MIYCNPNGGLYEFTSIQNEWVEFYLALGINVMLWNYRGYGRSESYSDMPSIARDAEYVLAYVKDTLKSEKIGVHGQSLGGSIAVRLGRSVDFVFADRTFRGLSDVALFSYGKVVYWIYRLLGPSETEPVKDYMAATCYKVISCDPDDSMIPNISSLKAGVAYSLKFPMTIAGTGVYSILKPYANNKDFNELIESLKLSYKPDKNRDEDSPEVDITGSLCSLEVFGRSLYKIGKKKEKELELVLWFSLAHVWPDAYKALKITLNDIQNLLTELPESEDSELLKSIYRCVNDLLQDDMTEITNDSNCGFILSLSCGHNSSFTPYELYLYKLHLKASNFIKNS